MGEDKSHRAAASQFMVAGELSRRGLVAVLTLGNCPNTDILVSNKAATKFAHVQVKTYRAGRDRTVSVGRKAEKNYGPRFFWVLAGIPAEADNRDFEYFVVPAEDMARVVSSGHQKWLETPGKHGQPHKDNNVRIILLPTHTSKHVDFDLNEYREAWDRIRSACGEAEHPR